MSSCVLCLSDHLPQFLFAPNVLSKVSCQKSNIYEKDWSKFIQTDSVFDYFDKDRLFLDQEDENLSIEPFLKIMNSILDTHATQKWINKYN